MTFITPQFVDAQEGYSLEVAGEHCSVVVFILSETVPPVTTGVQIDGVECTQILEFFEDIDGDPPPFSLQAWVLDEVVPGSVTITIDGDQDFVYSVSLKSSGGYLGSSAAMGHDSIVAGLEGLGEFSGRAIGFAALTPDSTGQIFNDEGDRLYQNDPDFTVNLQSVHANAFMNWVIEGGDDDERWVNAAVAFAGIEVEFTPSPCASLYFESDLVPGLHDGDTTDIYPLPLFGTEDVENWGGGSFPSVSIPEGFYWHETGAPGTDGPWMEQHNDIEFEAFPGAFHRQMIQNEFSDDLDPSLYEWMGKVLGNYPGHAEPAVGHWTLFSVMWCSSQPDVLGNPDTESESDRIAGRYPYTREWFGSNTAWGLAYYSRDGQYYLAIHSGYDIGNFLELPVDLNTWNYIEARQDEERLYFRVNETEISMPRASAADILDDWDNSIQWGDWNHHAGWTLLQICSTLLHCERRQTRRWEIQDKYGFPRSPVEDCSGDPEPPTPIILARLRPQVTVVGF